MEVATYCEVCFLCGALFPRHGGRFVEIQWAEEDPGRDEVGPKKRWSRVRVCRRCGDDTGRAGGGSTTRRGLAVRLAVIPGADRWQTRKDRALVVEGVRKVKV